MSAYAKVAASLLLIMIGVAASWYVTRLAWRADVATIRAAQANVLTDIATSTAATAEAVHKAFAAQTQAFASIDGKYQEGRAHAETESNRIVAGLRDGTVQLRDQWATCRATAGVLAATRAAKPDAGTDDRAASAGRIVAAADQCDAQVNGLQAALIAERAGQ